MLEQGSLQRLREISLQTVRDPEENLWVDGIFQILTLGRRLANSLNNCG